MNVILQILTNQIFLSAVIATVVSQAVKFSLVSIKNRRFMYDYIFRDYGGMPSSHTAFFVGIFFAFYFTEGITHLTILALLLTFITIRQVTGELWIFKRNDNIINQIIGELQKGKTKKIQHYASHFGHSLSQVAVGALIGFLVAVIVNRYY